jgi:prolipoprotein diacylglyceryltransferase
LGTRKRIAGFGTHIAGGIGMAIGRWGFFTDDQCHGVSDFKSFTDSCNPHKGAQGKKSGMRNFGEVPIR